MAWAYGSIAHHGDLSGAVLNAPIVGMAVTPSGDAHWLVIRAGQLQSSGLAARFGAPTPGPPSLDPPPLGDASVGWETFGLFDQPMAIRARSGDSGNNAQRRSNLLGTIDRIHSTPRRWPAVHRARR